MSTNLQFLRGTQANLNKIESAIDGAFYLTTDTNRLYVGQGTALVELNKSVTTVSTFDSLPKTNIEEGQFYYVSNINVLCVYKGGKWVQINPDTKLDSVTTTVTDIAATEADTFDKKVSITHTFVQTSSDENDAQPTNTDSFETKNLKVEKTGDNVIRFTGDTYEMNVPSKQNTVTDGTITSYNKEAEITLKRNVAADGSAVEDTVKIVGSKGISSIVSDKDTQTITITPTTIDSMSNSCSTDGQITIGVQETEGGKNTTTSFTPKFKYGKTEQEVKFDNNYTVDFDVYTTSEVDKIASDLETELKDGIRANNAMIYKGITEDLDGHAPVLAQGTKVSNGDLYMLSLTESKTVSADGKTITYKSGDFFIASGDENAEGYIEDITWNYIPAGNDTYVTKFIDNEYRIIDGQNSNNIIGSVKVAGDDDIIVTPSYTNTPSGGVNVVYTVTHGAQETDNHNNETEKKQDAASKITDPVKTTTITTVDNLTVDDNGHVTGWDAQTVELVDSHNRIDGNNSILTITPAEDSKSTSLTTQVSMTDGDSVTYTNTIKTTASNLEIVGNNTNKSVELKLVWGTF